MTRAAPTVTRAPAPAAPWAVVSSAAALPALVGGWALAAALQPPGYDPVRQTISALAAAGAAHRWVMTAALAVVGLCHLVTAAGLPGVRAAARAVLAVAGVAGVGVAAFPQPVSGSSAAHVVCASVSIAALAVWPLTPVRRGGPGPLRPATAAAATAVTAVLAGWLAGELAGGPGGGSALGLAERALTAAEAAWPLVVVLALRRAARASGTMGA